MKETRSLPQAPEFIAERVTDDRFARFGKTIVERDYRMPNGKVLPFLCTANPGADPVIIFAVTEVGTVFLVNQFRFATGEWTLELPGGCPESGQTWEDAAKAELEQEIGAEASELEVIGGRMPFNPAFEVAYFRAVVATGCKVIKAQDLDDTEAMTVREVTLRELRQMLKNGEITDAKTVATSYIALDHLGLLG